VTAEQLKVAQQCAMVINSSTRNPPPAPGKMEVAARLATQRMGEDFSQRLNASVSDVITSGLMVPGATVNNTMTALHTAVREAVAAHRLQFADAYSRFVNTSAMREAQKLNGVHTVEVLLPLYRTLTQSLVQGSLAAFDRQVARLQSTRRLPEQLRILSEAVTRGFTQSANKIREEFEVMVGTASSATPMTSGRSTSPVARHPAVPQLVTDFELQCLNEFLRQRCEDTQHRMFLSGEYNPYVRETAVPPTHINVNYLLDPRTLVADRELRGLYDSHKDGPCESRADPMYFPGMATVPFNPNQHPVSTEKGTSWVNVVKDFFGGR
jgi:hypothetical protein